MTRTNFIIFIGLLAIVACIADPIRDSLAHSAREIRDTDLMDKNAKEGSEPNDNGDKLINSTSKMAQIDEEEKIKGFPEEAQNRAINLNDTVSEKIDNLGEKTEGDNVKDSLDERKENVKSNINEFADRLKDSLDKNIFKPNTTENSHHHNSSTEDDKELTEETTPTVAPKKTDYKNGQEKLSISIVMLIVTLGIALFF
uniref:DUF148 domain-containing protein n=1 Tax=Rhabditophanes sp. KR3021 TaxID=114890 RepID=A0AC35TJI5_9BILA